MKVYNFNAVLHGTVLMESPRCPSYWRGSGCHDEEVRAKCGVGGQVIAESEDQAMEFIVQYDGYESHDRCELYSVDDVDVQKKDIEFVCEEEDLEYGVDPEWLSFSDADIPENNGPDGDELYEMRRDASL